MKQDLTQQGPLTMLRWCGVEPTLNDAWNKALRAKNFSLLQNILDGWFEYTPEQMEKVREKWLIDYDRRYSYFTY